MSYETLPFEQLTGTQKVAIFLMAVGEEATKLLFEKMEDEEIRQISIAMANLGMIDKAVVEKVIAEFMLRFQEPVAVKGNFQITEKFLKQVLPNARQTKIVSDIQAPAGQTVWDKLLGVDEQILANYLKNEYPQTIAVILSQLQPAYAAKVMALLPESLVMDIVMRMLHLNEVQKDILDEIEQTLQMDFLPTLNNKTLTKDRAANVADIFNNLDKKTENKLMTELFERNRDIAQTVRARMFTFEDLADIDSINLQKILRTLDKRQLAIALKGASETLKSIILENMSENAAMMLMEDMDALSAVRVKDIDAAQSAIVEYVKKVEQDGNFNMSDKQLKEDLL